MSNEAEYSYFVKRLRDEIENGQSRRHDFCVKKLAFTTGLLGIGSLGVPFKADHIDLTSLLWLVPVVSLAFDLYIVSEDYGVKRAGAFLGKLNSGAAESERIWESEFVHEKNNKFAPFAFFIVSIVLWGGAAMLLLQSHVRYFFIIIWSIVIFLTEIGLLVYSLQLRSNLKE
ncbi:MAG: hypothetical protein Q8L35_06920 [Actinomycetota bacterium]|nr:hypothetical protein [Actinomycetota bacterium]